MLTQLDQATEEILIVGDVEVAGKDQVSSQHYLRLWMEMKNYHELSRIHAFLSYDYDDS